jgi:hypothetical protein
MSRTRRRIAERTGREVITTPAAAVERLKKAMTR